jgi:nucleoid-associated protein EbfC
MRFPGGNDIRQMMKQAQKMQDQMAKEMEALRVEASAGGGMVKCEMTGNKELTYIKIDAEAANDLEMLQDLIVAAVNEANRKVEESMQSKLGGALGGLKIPGLM